MEKIKSLVESAAKSAMCRGPGYRQDGAQSRQYKLYCVSFGLRFGQARVGVRRANATAPQHRSRPRVHALVDRSLSTMLLVVFVAASRLAAGKHHGGCTDTTPWDNNSGKGCTEYAKFCSDGAVRAGAEWSLGPRFNSPERHCCVCGKGRASASTGSGAAFARATPPHIARQRQHKVTDGPAADATDALQHATKTFQAWFAGSSAAERDQFWRHVSGGGNSVLPTGIPVDVAARLHANAAVPPLGLLRGLECRDAAMRLRLGGEDLHALNDNYQDAALLVPEDAALLGTARFLRLLPHPCQDAALGIVATHARKVGSGDEWTGMIQQLLKNTTRGGRGGGLVVDIGANLGQYTLASAALGHRVISLEVQTRRYQQIATSLFVNGWLGSRVTAINAAVGAPSDEGSFLKCSRHAQNRSVVEYGPCAKLDSSTAMAVRAAGLANEDLVPFTTLDALVPSPTVVHFLKIDCDGCEPAAYRGYERLLTEGRVRNMLVETVAAAWMQGRPRDAAWFTELVTRHRPVAIHLASTQSGDVFPKLGSGTGCLAGLSSSLATALDAVLRAAGPSTGWQHQRAWVRQLAQTSSSERQLSHSDLGEFFAMTARCAAARPDRYVSFDMLLQFEPRRRWS